MTENGSGRKMVWSHKRILLSLIGLIVLVLLNCSSRKNPGDLAITHPIAWSDPNDIDFHGKVALQNGIGSCAKCHGEDLDGGEVEVSCVDCHLQSGACSSCHGGQDNITGAPPAGLHGETEPTTLAVGAHTAHLTGNDRALPVNCGGCHIVPLYILDSTHFDGQTSLADVDSIAEIVWHGISDGNQANWNRSTGECSNVYCHGSFAGGNADNQPVWTDSLTAACGSCHPDGTTPEDLNDYHHFHVSIVGFQCSACHSSVVNDQLDFVNPELHINGLTDTSVANPDLCSACHGSGEGSCTSCHGGVDNQTGAPPTGLRGETEFADLAVGAHTTHLDGDRFSVGFPCSTCHRVPVTVADSTHLGADLLAEITWSTLAGANARWDRADSSCSSTYCHGNFTGGKRSNQPHWNQTGQAECGSCHDDGTSPGSLGWKHAFHVGQADLSCGECHANVIDTLYNFTGLDRHVNGVVDTLTRDETVCLTCHGTSGQVCTLCHGGIDNQTGAPPAGLFSVMSTDSIGVGAHTAHVDGRRFSDGVDCASCHLVPVTAADPEHLELGQDNIAEITWSGVAGPQATWNRQLASCTDTYCHGNFDGGQPYSQPIWTDSLSVDCGSCHPSGMHPGNMNPLHSFHVGSVALKCADCHASVIDRQLNFIGRELHVNGINDTLTGDPGLCTICHSTAPDACVACHGGMDNQTGAPPTGLRGETAVSDRAVGAHTAHLQGSLLSDGIDCRSCHLVPSITIDPEHLAADSVAEINWGPLAGVNGNWDRITNICTDVYCHGDFRGGDALNQPVWTGTGQAECGSCHDVGNDPTLLRDRHDKHVTDKNIACYQCHSTTTNASLSIIGPDVHIDGINTVSFSSGQGEYTDGQCSNTGCHGTHAW